MKILTVHLSDMHIKGEDDPVVGRSSHIASAVKNLEYSLDACLVIVTGDVAFSGTDEQYLTAYDFFADLSQYLKDTLSGSDPDRKVPIHLAIAPGNHDCDFTLGGAPRQIVAGSVLQDTSRALDDEIIQSCTSVQDSFFNFLGAVESSKHEPSTANGNARLAYEYSFVINEEIVKVCCYNTAWLSQRHESQGRLHFPSEAVGEVDEKAELLVAAFHHPYNWLEANAARAFRNCVEAISDLVLTGHEHTVSVKTQEHSKGSKNICIEGGVLQDSHDANNSDFNAFVFDTQAQKRKYAHFRWHNDMYKLTKESVSGADGGGLAWIDYSVNDLRIAARNRLSEDMRKFLDDPGIDLRHQHRGQLQLQDVFLYPDLVEIEVNSERFGQRMSGEDLLDKLEIHSRMIITGDTESGKTCLAKKLFLDLIDQDILPVFLDGTKRPPTGDRLFGYLEEAFVWQYSTDQLDSYRQTNREQRAVIVDDYDKLPLSVEQKKEFVTNVAAAADIVILLAHDVTADLGELASPGTMSGGSIELIHCRIQPFGHVARNRLAERWLLLGDPVDPADSAFVQQLDRLNRTLNTIVGRNYVPSYPVYVLAVLQAYDNATPIDVTASTHGYFYELFIRSTLARGRTSKDFDVIASYLAFIAYEMQQQNLYVISEAELKAIHAAYEEEYDIHRPYESMKSQLAAQEVLVQTNDLWKFKYSYVYNYFVASYMRDHIGEQQVRSTLSLMARNLHVERNANVLLFLAHLSKAPQVIEELLDAGRELYADRIPAELSSDIGFLAALWSGLPEAVYHEKDPKKNREALLEEMDRNTPPESGLGDIETEVMEPDAADPIVRFIAALRHLESLGQILKNFPGSLPGTVKLDVARECFHLGLRAMTEVLEMIKDEQTEILNEMTREIKERHSSLMQWQVDARAKESLTGLVHMLAFGLIRRIAKAVGSQDLFNTYEKLIAESRTPAFELVNSSLNLDHSAKFPHSLVRDLGSDFKDAPLPLSVLRHLVVEHFHLFPVEFKTKQSISSTIGIRYSSLQAVDPRTRMLPRGS